MTIEVTIPTKIRKVCSEEIGRYSIHSAEFRPDKANGSAWVTATNGKALAIIECGYTANGDELPGTSLIPPNVLPERTTDHDITLDVNAGEHNEGSWRNKRRNVAEAPIVGAFPPCGDILPEAPVGRMQITLDAKLLHDLALAICEDSDTPVITLIIEREGRPIAVNADLGGFGVLMPVQVRSGYSPIGRYNSKRLSYKAALKA